MSSYMSIIISHQNPDTVIETKKVHDELDSFKKCVQGLSEPIRQHHNRFVTDDDLNRQWQTATHQIKSPREERSYERMKHYVERLRESWQHLLRDRATRSLTYNDEQFHALEKIKVRNYNVTGPDWWPK